MFDIFKTTLGIFSWQDVFELTIIATSIYFFLRWLSRDTNSPLAAYVVGIFFMMNVSSYLNLSVLTKYLIVCLPWTIIMVILFHQKMLQRNFVAFQNVSTDSIDAYAWIQVIVRACVRSMNENQQLIIIIEQKQSVAQYLAIDGRMKASINDDLMLLILEAYSQTPTLMILIQDSGYVKGVPVFWMFQEETKDFTTKDVYDALMLTANNDALVIIPDLHMRVFSVIMHGAVVHQVNAAQLVTVLERIFVRSISQGEHHEITTHLQQQTPA